MSYHRHLSAYLLTAVAGIAPTLAAHAAPMRSGAALVAFVRADNVWVAGADGTGARQITRDGTGTRVVNGRQVTYAYLTWSPTEHRLLVARFESTNPPGGTYRQGWSLQTSTLNLSKLVPVVENINSQDFIPEWSRDGRTIAYIADSSYHDKTLTFQNTVKTVDLSGRIRPLVRFGAREGCLDSSTDPSELTFWNLVGPGGVRQTFIWSSASRFLVYSTECIHTGLKYRSLVTGQERVVGRSMTEAALAPAGTRLIGVDRGRLNLSNADGTGRHVVSATTGARVPVWSPDGRFVYYTTRHTLQTLRYRDHAGNLFEIGVNRASIDCFDVASGAVTAILTLPVHAFANLAVSSDGRWVYSTEITNSDRLYHHLVHSPVVTNALLTQYGPRTHVLRVSSGGGAPQTVAQDSGQVAVSNTGE